MTFLILILVASAAGMMLADLHSSAINRQFPDVFETTRFFQDENKQANIPKMATTFAVIFALMLVTAYLASRYIEDLRYAAFAIFPLYTAFRLPHIAKNYSINRKQKAKRARG
ncbi:MAG TPA: hypothetical protein VNI84_18835 [Pyrinomonadaceae bacterium]|nr:hypothetical protein [Pyrinomonadaceae bacterium]